MRHAKGKNLSGVTQVKCVPESGFEFSQLGSRSLLSNTSLSQQIIGQNPKLKHARIGQRLVRA